MDGLADAARSPGRVYLTGGTSAVLVGWRNSTNDSDLKFDPEPAGIFEAIPKLKQDLDINIEMASPDQFIPIVPGWEERSVFILEKNRVEFFHYDFYSQALAKLERSHLRDICDVSEMAKAGLIKSAKLFELFQEIEPMLIRYPSVDPLAFRAKVEDFLSGR